MLEEVVGPPQEMHDSKYHNLKVQEERDKP